MPWVFFPQKIPWPTHGVVRAMTSLFLEKLSLIVLHRSVFLIENPHGGGGGVATGDWLHPNLDEFSWIFVVQSLVSFVPRNLCCLF